MTIPGDWHAGLNMLQSIHNVFWDGFLAPFCKALKWNKVYKDCRNCYYRASTLVLLVHNEIVTHLMQTYASEFGDAVRAKFESENTDHSPDGYVCFFAESFASWVDELADGDDHWLKACCLFVTMSKDFFTFVDSYRSGDAIGVEMGYQSFVAVWRALGQTRYLERHWRQQEQMLFHHPFSWLEMLRRHRFVRKYHGSTGKGTLAMDECLELLNRFYAQFPKVRTLEAFARQGNYIGLAVMCKRMVLCISSHTSFKASHVYQSGSTPKLIKECTKVYEILTMLETSVITCGREFEKNRVWNVIDKTSTALHDAKLTKNATEYTNDQAFQFLSSVGQILDELVFPKDKADDEDEIDTDECVVVRKIRDAATNRAKEQANSVEGARVAQAMDDDANRTVEADVDEADLSDDALSQKLGYNRYMIASVWCAGEKMLSKDNVKETRLARMALKRRKQRINKAIMAAVSANRVEPSLVLKDAKNIPTAPWTKFVMGKFNRFYL